jgi:hypothetical protein
MFPNVRAHVRRDGTVNRPREIVPMILKLGRRSDIVYCGGLSDVATGDGE